jgi:RNA polymerase sigma factor (sigma-70 family)
MPAADLDFRLSRISTQWSLVFQAHGGPREAVTEAQRILMQRYAGAVYRYLLGAVRDEDAAEELAQEFALRLVRGDFRRAHPERGRFRSYLKTALIHLVTDYHRARQAQPRPLAPDAPEPAAPPWSEAESERHFVQSWREELLERTWKALRECNDLFHAALLLRVQQPDLTSAQIAETVSTQLQRPINAALVRKSLQRAHEKFADLLLDEVAGTLQESSPDDLETELGELDLLRYCKTAFERRKKSKKADA